MATPKKPSKRSLNNYKDNINEEIEVISAKKNKQELKDQILSDKDTRKKIKEEVNSTISDIVKAEAEVMLRQSFQGLDLTSERIAVDVANGLTEDELKKKHQLTKFELDNLYSLPAFVKRVKELTYNNTVANPDIRIQMMNRVIKQMFENMITPESEEQLQNMSMSNKLQLMNQYMQTVNKMTEKDSGNKKTDLTVFVQNVIKDQTRITKNGETIEIKSKFPTLNQDGQIVDGEGNIIEL